MDALVIGAGVIGVCSAYFLRKEGWSVTLLDQGEIGGGCSGGNAGLIVPSHTVPLARPGIAARGLRWLLDRRSPFFIKPGIDPALYAWLWRFRRAASEGQARLGAAVLLGLAIAGRELAASLVVTEAIDCHFLEAGLLQIFLSEEALLDAEDEHRRLAGESLQPKVLDRIQVRSLEPAARADIAGGLYYPGDASLDPGAFVRGLSSAFRSIGGVVLPNTAALDFDVSGGRITRVRTSAADFSPDVVVLAAGAWTPALAHRLGIRIPVQPAKGYSLTYVMPEAGPRLPLYLGEAWVAVTPLGDRLRLAGTLELGGMGLHINPRRLSAVAEAPARYMDLAGDLRLIETWSGLRPVTPDGLPVIGRPEGVSNLIVAAGHAMLGMTMGPATGRLVADLAGERQPLVDIHPFRVERF